MAFGISKLTDRHHHLESFAYTETLYSNYIPLWKKGFTHAAHTAEYSFVCWEKIRISGISVTKCLTLRIYRSRIIKSGFHLSGLYQFALRLWSSFQLSVVKPN